MVVLRWREHALEEEKQELYDLALNDAAVKAAAKDAYPINAAELQPDGHRATQQLGGRRSVLRRVGASSAATTLVAYSFLTSGAEPSPTPPRTRGNPEAVGHYLDYSMA